MNLYQDHMEHLFLYCLLYMMNYPFHVQTNCRSQNKFWSSPTFFLGGMLTVFQELLYWRQFMVGGMRGVAFIPGDSYLLKDGLNLNFRVTWVGQTFNIFVLFLFSFFSEVCSSWGIFTWKTVCSPSLCIWPLEQMLCSLGPSDLDFFVHIFLLEIKIFFKSELKKVSYRSTAIQAVQNMS